ncbi:aminotransferase DegT [Clostridiaceae bacterium]|nr:aminotransferase DegT [Clostridiaceae bacterium]
MIPLYKPYMPELPELNTILYSGYLASGVWTKEFEKELRSYISEEKVLAVNTFHSAVSVAIATAGCTFGDEVIASPMACLASTQPYAAAGLKIVWADVDPNTGTLDPSSVERKVTKHTKCIVHNHFCGYPGYIDEVNEIGRKYGIFVIDDGIECFGTTYKGKRIGNCGTDMTIFSFNPVRTVTTIDGGAVFLKKKELYDKGVLIRDCGIDRSNFRDELGEINPNCDIQFFGYSATLSNVNAYIGIQQMKTVDKRIAKQRRIARIWDEKIKEIGPYKPLKSGNGEPNYWVYGMLVPDKKACIKKFREMGYYASGVHVNNNIYSIFGKQDTLPGVNEFFHSFVAIPCGWWMEEKPENG